MLGGGGQAPAAGGPCDGVLVVPALTGAVLAGSPVCPAVGALARLSRLRGGAPAWVPVLQVPGQAAGAGRPLGLPPPPASLSWPPSAFEAVCFRWAVLLRRRGWVPARCRLRQLGTRPPCGGRPDAQNSPAAGPGPTPRPLGWCRLVAWPLGVPARLASGQPGKRSRSPPQSGCAGQLPRPGGAVMARRGRRAPRKKWSRGRLPIHAATPTAQAAEGQSPYFSLFRPHRP